MFSPVPVWSLDRTKLFAHRPVGFGPWLPALKSHDSELNAYVLNQCISILDLAIHHVNVIVKSNLREFT